MAEACELVSQLNHIQQCITRELEDALKAHNLSLAKYKILNTLVQEGGRLPFSTLVERLGCVRSNVTGLIDRLQEDRLVRRVDHPEDRRMLFAELTDEGRTLITETAPQYDRALNRIFSGLKAEQRDMLGELLDILER